jgi:hypothetical protein
MPGAPLTRPWDDRVDIALDAALELLTEGGRGNVIPSRAASRSGLARNWFTRSGIRNGQDLQSALLDRELPRIAGELHWAPGAEHAARILVGHLPALLLADHHGRLREPGPVSEALHAALLPCPWWVAVAWLAICTDSARRGMRADQLFRLLLDMERRSRI